MKLIYLAHPYGGDENNVEDAKQMVKRLVKKFPETVFLSPLQATGFYYNDIPYIQGMEHCLEMLSRCDELLLCSDYQGGSWQESKGCCMECTPDGRSMPFVRTLQYMADACQYQCQYGFSRRRRPLSWGLALVIASPLSVYQITVCLLSTSP
jgi:hypothetical protein